MKYLICYDIVDDRKRTKLAEFLLDYGDRVQYSVFEFDVSEKILDILVEGVVKYVSEDEDNLRIYRLCAECAGLVKEFGIQRIKEKPSVVVV